MSDIDTAAVDSLKALDPKRPIREADIRSRSANVRYWRRLLGAWFFYVSVSIAGSRKWT